MLAAVELTNKGMPLPSVSAWCLLPGLRGSVGFGPVFGPPHNLNTQTHPLFLQQVLMPDADTRQKIDAGSDLGRTMLKAQ